MTKVISLTSFLFLFLSLPLLSTSAIVFENEKTIAQVAKNLPEYSKAGFYPVRNSGREFYNYNVCWHFYKGAAVGAHKTDFDDSEWEQVNTPHSLELVSTQASGSNNYQGEAWYRKHFTVPDSIENKRLILHFEAIMGKCKVWLNGDLLSTHFGGYLPFSVDISNKIKKGEENIIAIWTDNSDDPACPPGKPQKLLDFSYFGGIYRDVWLIATNNIYISDPNMAGKIAGGGTFVHCENLSENEVTTVVQTDVVNNTVTKQQISINYILKEANGTVVSESRTKSELAANSSNQISYNIKVKEPKLWSPQEPYQYQLEILIQGKDDKAIDGVKLKTGIRKIEFRGKEGFYLNNKPYDGKLIGANRHQDFAYVGNALPNSGQWRDALLLKEAGCDIVRAAHYPADPAFMDACDALGLFFIVATPGWQFWNDKDSSFEKLVYEDIRNMVRRDRNHPSVLLWEPILNETHYPDYFAKKVHEIVHEEYPYQGAYTACDIGAKGQEHFDVVYSHPFKGAFYNHIIDNTPKNQKELAFDYSNENRSVFTREWGDCVDDWNSHNSPSRVSRDWGEYPQLVQAIHYAQPPFVYTSWESLYQTPAQHVGGALWHAFDHQRGYHPDPFYGGITDVFRQPKYSYYLFKSQRSIAESEPMIYIANEMTPFSQPDVTVFTNCDEVRLIVYETDTFQIKQDRQFNKMPSPVVVFKDVFDFADVKNLHREGKASQASIVAEGLVDGKVVVREKKMPATRASRIKLELANADIPLVANGADLITVIASIVDEQGNVKRLNNEFVKFEIEGNGSIVGDSEIMANPLKIEWGTAPVLVRSTTKAGKITIRASVLKEGINTPVSGELAFESVAPDMPFIWNCDTQPDNHSTKDVLKKANSNANQALEKRILELEKELNTIKLKEVEKQQEQFEGTRK